MSRKTIIKIGNISNISGNVNVAGSDVTTHQIATGLSAEELKQIFDKLYVKIETLPELPIADKEDVKFEVKKIQSAVTEAAQKNEPVDEGFLARRFRNIARMAPDVANVVLKTLVNPALGIAEVVKKISEKANEDAGKE